MRISPIYIGAFVLNALFILVFPKVAWSNPYCDSETVREIVGKLLVVGFKGSSPKDEGVKDASILLRKGYIGGVILYEENIENPKQLKGLIASLNEAAGREIIVAVDQEGGRVQRLRRTNGFASIEGASRMAENVSAQTASKSYLKIGKMLNSVGINVNLGPVLDLALNAAKYNGLAGRVYSSDPKVVSKYAAEFVKAHRNSGVVTVLKHFPGHGSASTDTHNGWADISASWNEQELEPYQELIKRDLADAVMLSHVFNRNIDNNYPASLSALHVKMLRGMGLKGLIFSDDLVMKAISHRFSVPDAMMIALSAGVNVLLLSNTNPIREFHEQLKNDAQICSKQFVEKLMESTLLIDNHLKRAEE